MNETSSDVFLLYCEHATFPKGKAIILMRRRRKLSAPFFYLAEYSKLDKQSLNLYNAVDIL